MTSARLSYELEEKLDALSRAKSITKSDMVKEALVEYITQEEVGRSSWELGRDFFGKYGSGDGRLSTDYKNRLKEKIYARRSPR